MKKKILIIFIVILFVLVSLGLMYFGVKDKNKTTYTYKNESSIYENETGGENETIIQENIENNENEIKEDIKDKTTEQITKNNAQESKGETTQSVKEKTQEASNESEKPKTNQTNTTNKNNSSNQTNTTNKSNTTNQNTTAQKNNQGEETNKTKSIYDYEFDIEKIRLELISVGKSMGLTHITQDEGVIRTPNNSSWASPITGSKNFQGKNLERSLKDYVSSMPSIIKSHGGTEIKYFTIYIQNNGNGSYTFYFLY